VVIHEKGKDETWEKFERKRKKELGVEEILMWKGNFHI
jgi:hypothetical protein